MKTIGLYVPISGFSEDELRHREQIVRTLIPEDVTVRTLSSGGSPQWVESTNGFPDAIQEAGTFLRNMTPGTCDVVIAAGALDPGLPKAREACPVPLIGPGEASLFIASIYGRPLSIVTVDEFAIEAMTPFLEQTACKPPIASIRSMQLPVKTILQDRSVGVAALRRECTIAVRQDGAEALFLGSMTLGTLGITAELQGELGVPVFDPLRIAVAAAVQCIQAVAATPYTLRSAQPGGLALDA